ncbi:hypothetical protein DH86_00003921 [Scytalidium sp. 3C]|nr:hypothetical protein DH86_00003921 [Scytalidium sp. 3C]
MLAIMDFIARQGSNFIQEPPPKVKFPIWASVVLVFLGILFWVTLIIFIPGRYIIAPVLACTIAAHFPLLWTHVAISEPSATAFYKRFAPLKAWRKITLPTAIATLMKCIASMLPLTLVAGLDLNTPHTLRGWAAFSDDEKSIAVIKGFSTAVLMLVLYILLVIPADVILTRVQASLLADECEPIVPFDRTFGGKVEENGSLSMLDAWRTFDWKSRIRLIKAYLKAFALQVAIVLLFGLIATTVVIIAAGTEALKRYLDGDKKF